MKCDKCQKEHKELNFSTKYGYSFCDECAKAYPDFNECKHNWCYYSHRINKDKKKTFHFICSECGGTKILTK